MDVSFVVLNYKQCGLVKQCIKGIVAAQPNLDYEIIVVDNNSSDNCLNIVEKMYEKSDEETQRILPVVKELQIPPIITLQAGENGGFAKGNNLGMKKARGKYIAVINPDVAVVPGAMEKMFSYMEQNEKVGMLGPKLINPDGSVQYSCRRFPDFLTPLYRRTFLGKLPSAKNSLNDYLMRDFNHEQNVNVNWLFGAFLFIRKTALEKVGYFDERFFMYFEDLDLCRRFWHEGFQVKYLADVEMVHYHQQLSAERKGILGLLKKGGRIHAMSGVKYFAKYLGAKLPEISDN